MREKDFLQYVVGKQVQIVYVNGNVTDAVLLDYSDSQIIIRNDIENNDDSESIVLLNGIICISPRDTTGNFTTVRE